MNFESAMNVEDGKIFRLAFMRLCSRLEERGILITEAIEQDTIRLLNDPTSLQCRDIVANVKSELATQALKETNRLERERSEADASARQEQARLDSEFGRIRSY